MKAPQLSPRALCSSKNACFLCNAFILRDGKMHTTRCHGRLYPGWRLPASPVLDIEDAATRFNGVLEDYARNSLSSLLSRRQKILHPDPNESTLLTPAVSASTVRSAALPHFSVKDGGIHSRPAAKAATENSLLNSPGPREPHAPSEINTSPSDWIKTSTEGNKGV